MHLISAGITSQINEANTLNFGGPSFCSGNWSICLSFACKHARYDYNYELSRLVGLDQREQREFLFEGFGCSRCNFLAHGGIQARKLQDFCCQLWNDFDGFHCAPRTNPNQLRLTHPPRPPCYTFATTENNLTTNNHQRLFIKAISWFNFFHTCTLQMIKDLIQRKVTPIIP